MGSTLHTQSTRIDDEDFGWIVGRSIVDVVLAEPVSWRFEFSEGGGIATDGGVWRLSSMHALVISSEDHGHPFGLGAPVDAKRMARDALDGARIVEARVRDGAPDLEIRLDNGLVLEVLALSTGYECWQTRAPSGRCVVVSGSRSASTWQEVWRKD